MKKLIALLLAALMAVTGTLACSEAAPSPSMTVTDAITFDHDACREIMSGMGMEEERIKLFEERLSAIEASAQKLVIVEDGFEYRLILNGNSVATLAGETTPDGMIIGSTLFPHYLLSMTNATLDMLMEHFAAEAQAEEQALYGQNGMGLGPIILFLIQKNSGNLFNVILSAVTIGKAESGAFPVDGDTYNTMVPVSINARTAVDGILDAVDQLLRSQPVVGLQNLLGSMDVNIALETPVVGDLPFVNITLYRYQDKTGIIFGPEYTIVDVVGSDGATSLISARVRREGENVRMKLEIPGAESAIQYEQYQSDAHSFVRLDVTAGKYYAALALDGVMGEESHYSFNIYFNDPAIPLISNDISVVPGGERQYTVNGDNKTVLSVEALLAGEEENGTLFSLLSDVALYSAFQLLSARYAA